MGIGLLRAAFCRDIRVLGTACTFSCPAGGLHLCCFLWSYGPGLFCSQMERPCSPHPRLRGVSHVCVILRFRAVRRTGKNVRGKLRTTLAECDSWVDRIRLARIVCRRPRKIPKMGRCKAFTSRTVSPSDAECNAYDGITVETEMFEHRKVNSHFINPCCFGEDFAAWLKEHVAGLEDHGFRFSEIIQEDYGWGFWVWHGKDPFWVALSYVGDGPQETPAQWVILASYDPRLNLLKRLFHKPDAGAMQQLWITSGKPCPPKPLSRWCLLPDMAHDSSW